MDAISVFRRAVAREPARMFAFDRKACISYAEANARSDAIASTLVESGAAPGATLGLCAPDSIALLLAIIGAWKAGLIPALIDPTANDAALAYFIPEIGAKLFAAPSYLHPRLRAGGATEVTDLDALGADGSGSVDRHGTDAPLYLSYTSGTTGTPRGALLRSEPVTLGTACISDRLGITREDVLLATTPASSSFQLVAAVLPAMHAAAAVGLVAGSSTNEIWTMASERAATVLVAYPLTLADMVNASHAGAGSSPFRLAVCGGSPLAPRIKRDYKDRLGIPLLESYGQSEFGGFMALGRPDDDGERARASYVGPPLPDRLAYIARPDGKELPAGVVGEVVVPAGYFAGYLNKPAATAETLAGGILHCGDLAVSDTAGYLKVLGRTREADAAGSRGGFLRELEDACYEHPAVKHAAVVEDRGSRIAMFVELLPESSVGIDELTDFASARVVPGLRPQLTVIVDKMPRTLSGKANRLTLSQRSQD